MSPPNIATFQSYLQPALNVARTPSSLQHALSTGSLSPESILNRIRNVSQADMIFLGVIGAELLGFFTIGEMIGRFKLVGYRGDTVHHETATPH
ncbi:hypothetical protein MMC09_006365 [Bachmanniomyces sp. S44760]|nr:hypothetical protein [Bachmanniomyces sp. S44760]